MSSFLEDKVGLGGKIGLEGAGWWFAVLSYAVPLPKVESRLDGDIVPGRMQPVTAQFQFRQSLSCRLDIERHTSISMQ